MSRVSDFLRPLAFGMSALATNPMAPVFAEEAHPAHATHWSYEREGEKVALNGKKVDRMALLPQNSSYYSYTGSLTTPPCSEGVNGMVMSKRSTVSQAQLAAFTKLFPHSTRRVQPLNDRTINGT